VSAPRVAAIVVQFGDDDVCSLCLESISQSEDVEPFTIVVDHNPQTSSRLRDLVTSSEGAYLSNSTNPGFAAGANAGIRDALGRKGWDFLAVLNADVRLAKDCLHRLHEALESTPGCGIAGPGILSESNPDTWWNAGGEVVWPSGKPRSFRHGSPRPEGGGVPSGLANPLLDVGFVCGAVLAFRPPLLEKTGMLPEHYFLYFEDADFSFRVRGAGFRTVVVPDALAWHRGGESLAGQPSVTAYYRARNRLIFSKAWNPCRVRGRVYRLLFVLRTLALSLLRFLSSFRTKSLLPALGAVDYLRGVRGKRELMDQQQAELESSEPGPGPHGKSPK